MTGLARAAGCDADAGVIVTDCRRCGAAYEPAPDDSDGGVCGPCRDVGPIAPRPDVACLVGPDREPGDPPEDPYLALFERIGLAAARIDEPDAEEWVALSADLDTVLADDTLDHAELELLLRELLLRGWQGGMHDDERRADRELAHVEAALRDIRDDLAQCRETLRTLRLHADTPILSIERTRAELGALDTRLRAVEAACTAAMQDDS